MNEHTCVTFCVMLPVLAIVSGCAVGHNSTLFVTKTNAGLDVSTTPPTLALDVDRTEGILTPQFENGKVLPALASFKGSSNKLFSSSAGSTYSTGDAAVTMAAMFGEPTLEGTASERATALKGDEPPFDGSLKLSSRPIVGSKWLSWFHPKFQESTGAGEVSVKPAFFATQTSLGLKVAWSGMTATVPDSVNVGYNRKEISLLPVSMVEVPATGTTPASYQMNQASLLATLDASSEIDGAPKDAGGNMVQFFAVGDSANLLAQQQYVRKAMFESMGGPAEEAMEALAIEEKGEALFLDRSSKIETVAKFIREGSDAAVRKSRVIQVLDGAYGDDISDVDKATWHNSFSNITDETKLRKELMLEFSEQADILYKNTSK